MEPQTIQQVASGATNHWYHNIGVVCGAIISFVGFIWKLASVVIYFRKLYSDLLKRIDVLEKEKCIDDIHLEVIKNMAQDLAGLVKRNSDEYVEKIREVHKRIDDYMMNECNRRKESISVDIDRRK